MSLTLSLLGRQGIHKKHKAFNVLQRWWRNIAPIARVANWKCKCTIVLLERWAWDFYRFFITHEKATIEIFDSRSAAIVEIGHSQRRGHVRRVATSTASGVRHGAVCDIIREKK